MSDPLLPHGLQHTSLLYPSLFPGVCSNSGPLSWWCHPNISSSVALFSYCLLSFPAKGPFPVNLLFASSGQSKWVYESLKKISNCDAIKWKLEKSISTPVSWWSSWSIDNILYSYSQRVWIKLLKKYMKYLSEETWNNGKRQTWELSFYFPLKMSTLKIEVLIV